MVPFRAGRDRITPFLIFTTLLGWTVVSGCAPPPTEPVQVRSQSIIPSAGEGIVLAQAESAGLSIQGQSEEVSARVELGSEFLFVSATDVNLDIDEPEEQIVVVKRRDDSTDRVRLLLADFDTLRNSYRITWEGVTSATNIRTFAVYTTDLVGDHIDEIVAVGTNNDGLQTMDVFRRQQAASDIAALAYRDIFAGSSDGSIEIVEQPRSDAYRTLQSNGVSFPIEVFSQNQATETPLDLLRTTWVWRVPDNRYVESRTTPIPAVQVEEAQLRELYSAEADEVETFLGGAWFRSSGSGVGEALELAYFDHTEREVVLMRGETQERFEWLNSYKTLYADGPGLWMNLRNTVLRTVRRQLSTTVLGVDSVAISVEGAEYWNGVYQRMTPAIEESVAMRYTLREPSVIPTGVFRNENDVELLLDQPFFRFRTRDFDWSGGYNLIQLERPVLELKVTAATLVPDSANVRDDGSFSVRYAMDYAEQVSEDRIIRRLTLEPVELTVEGLRFTGGLALILEQVDEQVATN